MHIRPETPADADAIERIEYAAFRNHPQHAPGAEPVEHRIVAALRADRALTLSLVAEIDGRPVGHLALSPARVGDDPAGWFLLGPIGVLPEHQRRGVGTALLRACLDILREGGALGVVLVGDPAYYGRFGFAPAPGLTWPGVPDAFVLGLALTDRAPTGVIVGHPAFSPA